MAYPETEMNAEIADILCGDKRLADYFESFDHCFSPDEMNALANLLANDVLRELNYRDLTISELPIEITFVLRWYIIRRIKGDIDRREFTRSIRNLLDIYQSRNRYTSASTRIG